MYRDSVFVCIGTILYDVYNICLFVRPAARAVLEPSGLGLGLRVPARPHLFYRVVFSLSCCA